MDFLSTFMVVTSSCDIWYNFDIFHSDKYLESIGNFIQVNTIELKLVIVKD